MAFSYFYCKNFKQSIDALGSRLHSTAKGVALLCIVLLYYDAALEVNLHAGVTDDDLLDHLLHDDSVIYVHDCAGEYVGRILHPAAAVFYSCGGEI